MASQEAIARAQAIKAKYERELMRKRNVVGVGIGRSQGKTVIRVYVAKDTPRVRKAVPEILDDVPVEIVVSGPFQAL